MLLIIYIISISVAIYCIWQQVYHVAVINVFCIICYEMRCNELHPHPSGRHTCRWCGFMPLLFFNRRLFHQQLPHTYIWTTETPNSGPSPPSHSPLPLPSSDQVVGTSQLAASWDYNSVIYSKRILCLRSGLFRELKWGSIQLSLEFAKAYWVILDTVEFYIVILCSDVTNFRSYLYHMQNSQTRKR
jgi:hypothetical protein